MRALLVMLLLASTAAAECPDKAPTRNYGEFRCASTGRVSWVETQYYYVRIEPTCESMTIAIVTTESDCRGRVTRTCSGVACQ
jgi:hypothetical protein